MAKIQQKMFDDFSDSYAQIKYYSLESGFRLLCNVFPHLWGCRHLFWVEFKKVFSTLAYTKISFRHHISYWILSNIGQMQS